MLCRKKNAIESCYSYRKLAWVGFEPKTIEFRSDAQTDCSHSEPTLCSSSNFIFCYTHTHACMHAYTQIYIETDREGERVKFHADTDTAAIFSQNNKNKTVKFTILWYLLHNRITQKNVNVTLKH